MPLRGLLLLLSAGFLFSVMSVLVKLATAEISSGQTALGRAVLTLALCLWAIRRQGISPWGNHRRLLFLRGAFGACGVLCMYFALTLLPLAEVITIHYLNPLFTALLAALFLKEKLRWSLALALAVSLSGTVVLVQPQSLFGNAPALNPLGIALAFGVSMFSAGAYTCVRHLRLTEKPIVIVFYFSLMSVPFSLPFALYDWRPVSLKAWLLIAAIGAVTQAAQVCLTHGLGWVQAGKATAVGYVQILFAAFFGWMFFEEVPSQYTAIGGTLVVAGFLILLYGKERSAPASVEDSAPQ